MVSNAMRPPTKENTQKLTTPSPVARSQSSGFFNWIRGFFNLSFRKCLIQDMNACIERQKEYETAIKDETDEKEIFKLLLLIDVAALGKYILQTQIGSMSSVV